MWTRCLGEKADHNVDIFYIIDRRSVFVTEAIIERVVLFIDLRGSDDFCCVTLMLTINLPDRLHQLALVSYRRPFWQGLVDEIIKAGELPQSNLPAEFVETRQAMFAVANNIKRSQVYFCIETRAKIQVLDKLRMVLQNQQTQTLPAHRQCPVGKPAAVHRSGCLTAERIDYRDSHFYFVGVIGLSIFE